MQSTEIMRITSSEGHVVGGGAASARAPTAAVREPAISMTTTLIILLLRSHRIWNLVDFACLGGAKGCCISRSIAQIIFQFGINSLFGNTELHLPMRDRGGKIGCRPTTPASIRSFSASCQFDSAFRAPVGGGDELHEPRHVTAENHMFSVRDGDGRLTYAA